MSGLDTIMNALMSLRPDFAKSDGSIEAKIIDVVGSYADSEAIERRNTLNVINKALASQKVTTINYYRQKAIEFQMGDDLLYDNVNQGGYYKPIRPENRIVKQASIVGEHPSYNLLVNAIGNDGHLRKLDPAEIASFKTYFQAFQPVGLHLGIYSPDVAKIYDNNIKIYIRKGADATAVIKNVKANLVAYESVLRPFNSVSLTEIEDVIQKEPSVAAVGFNDPYAEETDMYEVTHQRTPINGVFRLFNGAFTFGTEISINNIEVYV